LEQRNALLAVVQRLENQGLSPYTVGRRSQALGRLAKALPVPLLDATPDHLYEWRTGLTGKNNTIACYLSHVKGFYRWCVSGARPPLLAEDPAAWVPAHKVRPGVRPIPEPDLMLAYKYASHPVKAWFLFAGWCGLRVQEIALLRIENLRLRDTPPVLIVSAESAKGRRERVIDLAPWVVSEILKVQLPVNGYAFTDVNGRPFTPHAVSLIANQHLRSCGISAKFHDLRHRFLTQVHAATHDILITQALAGHATPATTAGSCIAARRRARRCSSRHGGPRLLPAV
jgi:integrase